MQRYIALVRFLVIVNSNSNMTADVHSYVCCMLSVVNGSLCSPFSNKVDHFHLVRLQFLLSFFYLNSSEFSNLNLLRRLGIFFSLFFHSFYFSGPFHSFHIRISHVLYRKYYISFCLFEWAAALLVCKTGKLSGLYFLAYFQLCYNDFGIWRLAFRIFQQNSFSNWSYFLIQK